MHKGVIYICFNSIQHEDELIYSARSLKKHNPKVSITVFTNNKQRFENLNLFDQIDEIENKGNVFLTKNFYLQKSPYIFTLFLHSDTAIHGNIDKLFSDIYKYDLLIAKNAHTIYENDSFNVGVMAFKKSPNMIQFLKYWNKQIEHKMGDKKLSDQNVLNTIFDNDNFSLAVKELNHQIYNVRKKEYNSLNCELKRNVIITHWHGQNI